MGCIIKFFDYLLLLLLLDNVLDLCLVLLVFLVVRFDQWVHEYFADFRTIIRIYFK